MIAPWPMILMATLAGVLVIVSRSVNGRLSLSTSPLVASFWNHAVGAGAILLAGLAFGGLMPARTAVADAPAFAWAGGTVGVVFIALGSYLVPRLGAALTAMLVIAGQMISGVLFDALRGIPGAPLAKTLGVVLILAGTWLAQRPAAARPDDQSSTR